MTQDELQVAYTKLLDDKKAVDLQLKEAKQEIENLTNDNNRLLKSNNELFVKITSEAKENPNVEEQEVLSDEEEESKAVDEIIKIMSNRRI